MRATCTLMPSALALALASSVSATTVPLRFVSADPSGARRRHRRLSADGELHGNLHTLGYFSAEVCLGTPAHSYDLIVDTGSSLTALPCKDCSQCGAHPHAGRAGSMRYDAAASSSGRPMGCGDTSCTTRQCVGGQASGACAYSASYTEGSSIRGKLMYDTFWFSHESAPDGRIGVHASFGCQTFESGLFKTQVADGITGLAPARTYGPTLFDAFVGTSKPNRFSICLAEEVGTMVLGGELPADGGIQIEWLPLMSGGAYAVPLQDIMIEPRGESARSVGAPASVYHSTIVDTGTTFMYLPPAPYRAVRDHFRNHCPWGTCAERAATGDYPDDYCYTMSEVELDALTPMSLRFAGGVSVSFGPRQYAYELRTGVWCLGVFDNEHNGAVIGASTIRNHEVIFDRGSRRLAFVPSDCGGVHAGTHASVLRGGYGLGAAGCAARSRLPSGSSARSPPPGPPPPHASQSVRPPPYFNTEEPPPRRPPPPPPPADESRGRQRGRTWGYLADEIGFSVMNSTSWLEAIQNIEGLAPGVVALIALGAIAFACCLAVLVCCARVQLRQLRREFEERLRLVTADKELEVFDDSLPPASTW